MFIFPDDNVKASAKVTIETPDVNCALGLQRQEQKKSDLDEQLKEYIAEWRKQRSKEEDDLKKLKEKQAKRKVIDDTLRRDRTANGQFFSNDSPNESTTIHYFS